METCSHENLFYNSNAGNFYKVFSVRYFLYLWYPATVIEGRSLPEDQEVISTLWSIFAVNS